MTTESNSLAEDDVSSVSLIIDEQTNSHASVLINDINATSFDDWYREREFARNIRKGQPYFNGPDRVPPPERHNPSQLNQCHRKVYYKQLNAPEEQPDPQGIFWTGTNFEEELVVPSLETIVGPDEYVRNSMWIDINCETDAGEIRIKGATDPVIVDDESEPLLLTESKTKGSVDHLTEPDTHHRAQAHAYMYGLTQKYDHRVTDAMLLYGSRNSLDLRTFHVPFDPWFWRKTVLNWAEDHTQYRLDEKLPAAEPEFSWECSVCSYRHRCGQADDTSFENVDATGLLPRFKDYPREQVEEYLNSHDEMRLTPTLACRYPALSDQYGVYDWRCPKCDSRFNHGEIESDRDEYETLLCPSCRSDGVPVPLTGPSPEDQNRFEGID